MEVDEVEAGLLEKFSSLQTVDQPGENLIILFKGHANNINNNNNNNNWLAKKVQSIVKGRRFVKYSKVSKNVRHL